MIVVSRPEPDIGTLTADAESLEEQSHWLEAVAAWRALVRDTNEWRFIVRAARASQKGGAWADAEELYREAIGQAPDQAAGFFGLGLLLKDQGRLEEARQAFEKGVALEEQPFALTILGIVQRWLDDLTAARATLQRSLELNPSDDEAHFSLGLVLEHEAPLKAVEHLQRALEIDSTLPNVRRVLGEVLWRLKRNNEAETILREALTEDASDAWSHYFLGDIFALRDDWVAARTEFQAATALEAGVGLFWRALGDACAMLDERERAEGSYLKALSLGVDDATTNSRYGLLLKRFGYFGKARAYLQRAIALDPKQIRAREALDELG